MMLSPLPRKGDGVVSLPRCLLLMFPRLLTRPGQNQLKGSRYFCFLSLLHKELTKAFFFLEENRLKIN